MPSRRPLSGLSIVLTRPAEPRETLAKDLAKLGARVRRVPTIRIAPPRSWKPFDAALKKEWDWVLFTSAHGADAYFGRLKRLRRSGSSPRLGAVGPATADAVRRNGGRVALVASEHRGEGLAKDLGDVRGKRILLAVADIARPALPDMLKKGGAKVQVLTAYRTVAAPVSRSALKTLADADVVVFTSSSTALNLAKAMKRRPFRKLFMKTHAASIGPVTSETLRALGIAPAVEANPYTTKGLVAALIRWRPK